jgi:hypothetical protein
VAVGTGSIAGIVVTTDARPVPVRRATIVLRYTERGSSRTAVSDDEGRFVVDSLPAGRFTISVSKPAFVTTNYGAGRPGGLPLPIALVDGQRMSGLSIPLMRGGVLTGRIVDDLGQAAPGIRVTMSEITVVGGERTYRQSGAGAVSDDRGVYRIYGVAPGTYVLAAAAFGLGGETGRQATAEEVRWALGAPATAPGTSQRVASPGPPPGRSLQRATTYYPSAADPSLATPVTIAAGEEKSGLDITMSMLPTATVSGRISRQDGQPVRGVLLAAVKSTRSANFAIFESPPRASVLPSGEFTIPGVLPGNYLVTARAPSALAPAAPPAGGRGGPPQPVISDLWASAEITVSGEDVSDLRLELAPGMTVSGRIVFDGASPPAIVDSGSFSVSMMVPPNSGTTLGVSAPEIKPDGTFQFKGVPPGSFLIGAGTRTVALAGQPAVPAWTVKSATLGGRDVLDTPFDVRAGVDVPDLVVTFTDRVSELSGMVSDQTSRPVPAFSVIVFSTDSRHWRQGSRWVRAPVRPASDGRFRIAGLPPGEYYLAVVTDFQPNEWYTPAFLQQIVPGAIRITIGEGEKKVQDVRLAG